MKILMLVHNNVIRDSRVLKEGDALAECGHSVDIVGLADTSKIVERRASGARVEWVKPNYESFLLPKLVRFFLRANGSLLRRSGMVTYSIHFIFILLFLLIFGGYGLLYALFAGLDLLVFRCSIVERLALLLLSFNERAISSALRLLQAKYRNDARLKTYLVRAAAQIYDVIHCHDWVALPAALEITKNTGAKLVWDAHEIYQEVAQQKSIIVKKYIVNLIAKSQGSIDSFITINESIAAYYAREYPELPEAVVVKNSVDYVRPLEKYDGRLHDAAGLPSSQKIILYQGGFAELRGLEKTIGMALHLHDQYSVVFMGWGGIEQRLRELAKVVNTRRQSVHPAVVFIPPAEQSELSRWTSGATLGLILYEKSGLNHLYCTPNKLWEYPAADVPCLCSDLVEMRKAIDAYGFGILVDDSLDEKSLAERINSINGNDYKALIENCRGFMAADHWGVYKKALINAYSKLEALS